MESKYVLIVCPIFREKKDLSDSEYTKENDFIECKNYIKDGDITKGLYGILWGKASIFPYKNILNYNWAVVKVKLNYDIVVMNKLTQEVKFRKGQILKIGNIKTCADYIVNYVDLNNDMNIDFDINKCKDQIIGTDEWFQKQQNKILY